MKALTKTQHNILRYLRAYFQKHGFPPTFRDIMAEFGISTTRGCAYHLDALENKGMLTRGFKAARQIKLTEAAFAILEEEQPPVLYFTLAADQTTWTPIESEAAMLKGKDR